MDILNFSTLQKLVIFIGLVVSHLLMGWLAFNSNYVWYIVYTVSIGFGAMALLWPIGLCWNWWPALEPVRTQFMQEWMKESFLASLIQWIVAVMVLYWAWGWAFWVLLSYVILSGVTILSWIYFHKVGLVEEKEA